MEAPLIPQPGAIRHREETTPLAGPEQEDWSPGYDKGGSPTKRSCHDSKTAIRRIPALFPQNQPENRQTAQPRHLQIACSRGEARARRAVFQAALNLRQNAAGSALPTMLSPREMTG